MIAFYESISVGGDVGVQTALIAIAIIAVSVALSVTAGFVLARRARGRD